MSKVDEVVIFSGGMDSATLLWWRLKLGKSVACVSVDYGQRHSKELEYAKNFVANAEKVFGVSIPHKIIDISSISEIFGDSSQTNPNVDVPHGHYADENMKTTVVPNRNMIMLSVATAWAISLKAATLMYGAHSGDHSIYPDCRPRFVQALAQSISLCDWHPILLEAPFIAFSKSDICVFGKGLGVPYSKTWTCYVGLDEACGKCGACQERIEAFAFADMDDK